METLKKQSLFWDVDLGQLNPQLHKTFIIKRVLQVGDIDDLSWAIRFYGKEFLRDIFCKSFDQFDVKSQNYWQLYFNLLDQSLCIPKQSMRRQSVFWKK